jgi:putative heme-binding domain-containing protein
MRLCLSSLAALLLLLPAARGQTLEKQLTEENPQALARAARQAGDARRGAVHFHQPQVGCTKCHAVDGSPSPLGPDLTKLGKDATDVHLVESVLFPSKVIRQGFESVTVTTTDGRVLTGLLAEDGPDRLVLREIADNSRLIPVKKADVEQRTVSRTSAMPGGLVNGLPGRQEFLNLIRYLMEIRDGGLARAKELQPPPSAYALRLPEYESHVDHAGLIAGWNDDSFRRGEAIYHRLCINCHGTPLEPGTLPTSLKFWKDKFKNGSDPYSLYQTLTRGYGMMTPQTWMVPQQKYDVIHFIQAVYLQPSNRSQYVRIDRTYLDRLPKGDTRGPKPVDAEPWRDMDYGPWLTHTYEVGSGGKNLAYKGVAVRLDPGPGGVARGKAWMLFDHDTLRVAAAWTGSGFIDWNGIQFNGRHQVHPRLVGDVHLANTTGPGWADPETGRFDDPRLRGRDNRPYGPLPPKWAHYRGAYLHGDRVIFSYTVGETAVLETPGLETDTARPDGVVITRTLNVAASALDLLLRVAPEGTAVAVVGSDRLSLLDNDAHILLRIPAAATPVRVKLLLARNGAERLAAYAKQSPPPESLEPLTHGGPRRWPDVLHRPVLTGKDDGPFAVDVLALPEKNPWRCQLRLTGFDFYPDGKRAAVCSWDGDIWLVSGFDNLANGLTWQRIASGLFQPLGLKIVDGTVYVTCRDQLIRLRDLNGDGEIDFYECFNNDHQVTEHFHEFAMGLQVDAAGNFYYAKAARHALPALVPHHGTLLKVSKDGTRTDILATGFRAPNGVCLNSDGTFFVTDQEGHWTPKNRINLVKPGGYYGNFWGYHNVTDPSDAAMEQPVCWITNAFDRSPAELLWVTSERWGALKGSLLNLSYGHGQIYVVPHETVAGQMQGGMCALPLPPFPTGIMRGRFHPTDGQLYTCGMFAWAGNQQEPGGFYRVRYTGKPVYLPVGLRATAKGVAITFSSELDPTFAADVRNYAARVWGLKRSANYGSPHVNERPLPVTRASLGADGRTVTLEMPDLKPTWGMEIRCTVKGRSGEVRPVVIHNTIHRLGE